MWSDNILTISQIKSCYTEKHPALDNNRSILLTAMTRVENQAWWSPDELCVCL